MLLLVVPPLVGWLTWAEAFTRSLTVLVASSPCALAISTPSAVLAGIAACGVTLVEGAGPSAMTLVFRKKAPK